MALNSQYTKLCLQCLLLLSFRLNSRALLCRVMGRWLLLFSCARITSRQPFFPSSLGNLSLSLCLYVTKNKKKKRNNQDTLDNLQQFSKFLIDSSDTNSKSFTELFLFEFVVQLPKFGIEEKKTYTIHVCEWNPFENVHLKRNPPKMAWIGTFQRSDELEMTTLPNGRPIEILFGH
ncbi:hypothetical protein T01_8390 [Trichinella spiralis]|uniref:Uncharacterized protein n=1 Tax=Trichinella spiralis TaxID=6334 RepID=A0A0V1B3M8_TRISP|nr:hypothetical protein T01_8390 [Trichinella spiralis]